MRFETYVKRGTRWSYVGSIEAATGRAAAIMTGYIDRRRIVAIRPEDSTINLQVYRFKKIPKSHNGRYELPAP